jgi:signal transduction histidine kinase
LAALRQERSSISYYGRYRCTHLSPAHADQALVAVQDSGTGIDPDKWTGLFTAFFTTKPDGMGMGLSICRSIIEAHGGEMWASPNDGFGATFSFTVQIEQGAAE